MGRETNRPITFFDAQYMVDNEGFEALQTIPQTAKCMTRAEIEAHINADISNFSAYTSNRLVPYHLLTPMSAQTAWRPIDPYCVQEDTYVLMLKTTSSNANWCMDRFRLYTPDSNTLVQARKPNGDIIGTQLFHDPNYSGWSPAPYEHTFKFDLSFNTTNDEIEIFVIGKTTAMKFQQLYAADGHATTGVRWGVDPGASGISNAQISYVNLDFLRFDYGASTSFVYLENQGLTTIIGADEYYGRVIDVSGNNISSGDIDHLIVGIDNNGVQPSNVGGATCRLQIKSGLRTSTSTTAWNNLSTKGWSLIEV